MFRESITFTAEPSMYNRELKRLLGKRMQVRLAISDLASRIIKISTPIGRKCQTYKQDRTSEMSNSNTVELRLFELHLSEIISSLDCKEICTFVYLQAQLKKI